MSGNDEHTDKLLPWLSTGRLTETERRLLADSDKVDAVSEARADHLRQIRNEADAETALAEAYGAPSFAVFERIEQSIAAEPHRAPTAGTGTWLRRISDAALAPRYRLSAALAMVLLAVQIGLVAGVLFSGGGSTYETASGPGAAAQGPGFIVSFRPDTTLEQITRLLSNIGAASIDGPKAGGLYRINAGPRGLTADAEAQLRTSPHIRVVLPVK